MLSMSSGTSLFPGAPQDVWVSIRLPVPLCSGFFTSCYLSTFGSAGSPLLHRLSLAVVSGGCTLVAVHRLLTAVAPLEEPGLHGEALVSGAHSAGLVTVALGLSCSTARGIRLSRAWSTHLGPVITPTLLI